MYEICYDAVPKVHPATREMLPDDPLGLHAVELDGDPELMLRLLVEEFARLGMNTEDILSLAEDPFYVAFHGLRQCFGPAGLRERVQSVLARVGVTRVRFTEAPLPPQSERLVQLEIN